MRNRKCGHCKRKEVDICLFNLKKEELLDLSKGRGRIFIDKRFWFSAEFVVAITT